MSDTNQLQPEESAKRFKRQLIKDAAEKTISELKSFIDRKDLVKKNSKEFAHSQDDKAAGFALLAAYDEKLSLEVRDVFYLMSQELELDNNPPSDLIFLPVNSMDPNWQGVHYSIGVHYSLLSRLLDRL